MSSKHFSVEKWEPGEPIDLEHLAGCEECRVRWELWKFVRFQLERAPKFVPPHFFASRVARLAEASRTTVYHFLDRLAKILVPTFASVTLATTLLLLNLDDSSHLSEDLAQVLVEPSIEDDITLDDVVARLIEEAEIEDPK